MDESQETTILIVGPERWAASSVFNTNAYPDEVRAIVNACSTRAAHILLNVREAASEVASDKVKFSEELNRQQNDLTEALRKRPDLRCVACYDGLGYLSALYGFLNSLKSFLDVYAKLMGKLIHRDANLSFKRATVAEQMISGGALINWLRSSAPARFEMSHDLGDLTERHSHSWITRAVSYRDTISHYSDIVGMVHMHVLLREQSPPFQPSEIVLPMLPNDTSLVGYCDDVLERLREYVIQSVEMLPDIDQELISAERFLA